MSSTEVFRLIQPDLLTAEELISILKERGVDSGLLSQGKDSLVSLYNRVALPLPQREFRPNYRGSLIMKKRRKREIISTENSPCDDKKNFTIGVAESGSSSNSNRLDKCEERLKPPPDVKNHEKKRIRLNRCGSSTVNIKSPDESKDLDKVIIKKRKISEKSCNDITKDAQFDKDSKSESTSSNNTESESIETTPPPKEKSFNGKKNESSCKRVLLKRNHLISKNSSESSANTSAASNASSTTESEPVKKRKPITWP